MLCIQCLQKILRAHCIQCVHCINCLHRMDCTHCIHCERCIHQIKAARSAPGDHSVSFSIYIYDMYMCTCMHECQTKTTKKHRLSVYIACGRATCSNHHDIIFLHCDFTGPASTYQYDGLICVFQQLCFYIIPISQPGRMKARSVNLNPVWWRQ